MLPAAPVAFLSLKKEFRQMHLYKTLHLRLQIIDKASERRMLLKGRHRVK